MRNQRVSAAGESAELGERRSSSAVKPRAKVASKAMADTGQILVVKIAKGQLQKKAAKQAIVQKKTQSNANPNPKLGGSSGTARVVISYTQIYRATPLERIEMIRRGIPASEAKRIFADLAMGQGAGFKALNLSTATVNKKAKHGDLLTSEESERIIGFAKLVGQLEAMIQESGDPTGFDARTWMARWLTEPLPAFGGARPADLVDTMEGQGLVSAALAKMQSGAYA